MRISWIACGTILTLLSGSIADAQEDAIQKTFQQRFSIPRQGHIELRHSFTGDFEGRTIQTEKDVLQLLDDLSKIPFSEEHVTSWKLFEEVGLKRIERPLPQPPPGIVGKVMRTPDWRKISVTFDKDHLLQLADLGPGQNLKAWSPISEVSIQQHPQHDQVNHYPRGAFQLGRSIYDVPRLFQREPGGYEQYYVRSQAGDREFWTWTPLTSSEVVIASRPDKDLIDAIYSQKGDRVFNQVSLHLYHQEPEQVDGMWIPRLILQLRPLPGGRLIYNIFLVQKADFTSPVDPQAFKVTARQGSTYVYRDDSETYVRKLPADVHNITQLKPTDVQLLLEAR